MESSRDDFQDPKIMDYDKKITLDVQNCLFTMPKINLPSNVSDEEAAKVSLRIISCL